MDIREVPRQLPIEDRAYRISLTGDQLLGLFRLSFSGEGGSAFPQVDRFWEKVCDLLGMNDDDAVELFESLRKQRGPVSWS